MTTSNSGSDNGHGRLAVVLGGANGIGAATALLLHGRGWKVVIADIDLAAAEATAQRCEGAAIHVDVLDAQSIANAAQRIEERHGAIYALVNAAAIFAPRMLPEQLPIETWDRIVDSSYRNAYVACVEFGKRMAAHGAGVIVNISSMVGQRPNHGHAYYSAKAAVNALTEGMAGEWGRSGVRVNAVSPGPTKSARFLSTRVTDPEKMETNDSLERYADPEEIADAVAFFAGPQSKFVSGQVLRVDGGLTLFAG